MFERFTKPARLAVEEAVTVAQGAAAAETRPEHLLQALLADEACLACSVLSALGAPPSEVREALTRTTTRYVDGLDAEDAEALRTIGIDLEEVARRIDRDGDGHPSRRGRPRFARSSKKVLELALREAISLRHNYIGTEHLLLGLVRGGDRTVVDTLGRFGIDRDQLRAAVADAVRQAG
jgi:ATP-dependent Clp protease ATP-binding subunit ClpA